MPPLPDDREASAAGSNDTAEVAGELLLDLRTELPRLDARAAAGAALTGAILVAVVTQRLPDAIYVFGVVAAVLLTLAILLFLAVLLPSALPEGLLSGSSPR